MDYEYWLRSSVGGAKIAHLPRILAGSRLYAETKTRGSRVRFHAEINSMMRRRLGYTPDRWLYNYAHAAVDARGIPRTARCRFAALVSLASLYAALRWNGRISDAMRATTRQWMGAGWSQRSLLRRRKNEAGQCG